MDPFLIFIQLLLGVLGLLGIASSAPELWLEQFIYIGAGLSITYLVSKIHPRRIAKVSPFAYLIVLVMLILVLFIGVSPGSSDSTRWLAIGSFTVQPSELMKVVVVAYLASFFYNHYGNWHIWKPMFIIGIASALILLEPDVSTTAFIFMLSLTIMLAAGTKLIRLFSITASAALIAIALSVTVLSQYTYIGDRFEAFVDSWGNEEHAQDISYQPLAAKRSLAKAGFFGVGPGRPVRVPEADTDMIAISVGQSLGLTGIVTLIFLYLFLAIRGVKIASVRTGPGSLLAAGATAYICGQAALNLLVTSGIFPITGVTLPFVSHGANGLVSVAIAMGFLQSAYRQAKLEGVEL